MNCKKYSVLVAIAAIAASCAKESTLIVKEEGSEISLEPMCIESSDESGTKTSLDGKIVNWTDGDCIAVYSNMDGYSKGYVFPASNISGKIATFRGDVPSGTTDFYAVYPPEKVVSANASGAVVTIPADQTPAVGTFGEELNITIGKGTKTPGKPEVGTIKFRNVCSYVKFTVPAYVSDVTKVKISADSPLAGELTINYKDETETPSSKITSKESNTISMTGLFGQGKTFIFVIAPGTFSNFKLEVTSDKGVWTRGVSADLPAKAGRPVNLGVVDFKINPMTATATHTYNGTILTGTDLIIENLNIAGYEDYVQKVHIDIIPKGQTTAVRSADITDFSTLTPIQVNSAEYPYLPQGTYTIKSTYTMSDGKTLRETSGEFSVPAPTFEITSQPTIYTSYSVYKSDNPIDGITAGASGANGLDGSSIYVKKGTVSIDGNLLTKYSSIASYTCTDGTTALNEGQNGNMGWSAHTVSSSFTFDGVTRNFNNVTCHVTGLPYKKDFTSDKGTDGWSGLSTSKNNKAVCLGYFYKAFNSGTITYNAFSPSFNLPTSTNVKYTAVHYYGATGWYSPSGTIYSGVTDNNTTIKTQQKTITGDTKYLTNKTPSEFKLEDNITMNSTSKISLSGSCGAKSSVENFVELAYFEIIYR